MAGDVDPVPALVPRPHRLDRTRIRLGTGDVLVRVGLHDGFAQDLLWDLREPPGGLLVVFEVHAVALANDRAEEIPVVMESRIDVDAYTCHVFGYVIWRARVPEALHRYWRLRRVAARSQEGRRRLRPHRGAELARRRLALAPPSDRDRRPQDHLRRHRRGRQAARGSDPRSRRLLAELAREHPAAGAGSPLHRARP